MNKGTEPALEILRASGDWRSTSDVVVNMNEEFADPPSERTVYRAINDMLERAYVGDEDVDESRLIEKREFSHYGQYYRITTLGEAYLDGEIDGGAFEDQSD